MYLQIFRNIQNNNYHMYLIKEKYEFVEDIYH